MNGQFDFGAIDPVRYFASIAVGLGLVFALIAEPNEDLAFWQHLLLWQFQALTPMALMILSHLLLMKSPPFRNANNWVQLLFSGIGGIILFTPLAMTLDLLLMSEATTSQGLLSDLLEEFTNVAPPVVVTWIAINAPWLIGYRMQKPPSTAEDATSTPRENNTFLEKSGLDKGDELIYLKAELHYLQVVTTAGNSLLLYNLKDAVAELPNDLGVQCHRSYWVNRSFIQKFRKSGREGELELTDGSRIPVSRSRVKNLTGI